MNLSDGLLIRSHLQPPCPKNARSSSDGLNNRCLPLAARTTVSPPWRGHGPSAELLGKPNDDALGAADVGQPVRVPVLHLADELCTVRDHAGNDSVDVLDGEHD